MGKMNVQCVNNYHGNNTISDVGHLVVATDFYRARWSHENPHVIYVRGFEKQADWVEWKIGGYISTDRELHLPDMDTLTADFSRIQERTANSVCFSMKTKQGGTYEYVVNFLERRITMSLTYNHHGTVALRTATLGAYSLDDNTYIDAEVVFNPNPLIHGVHYTSLRSKIMTGSISEKWFSPAPFCFPMKLRAGDWMSVSLAPSREELHFSGFTMNPGKCGDVSFQLDYASLPEYDQCCKIPALVLQFGAQTEFAAMRDYANGLVDMGLIQPVIRQQVDWWRGVMICGWNNQGGTSGCTQECYEKHIATYEKAGIPWKMLTIDDFWGKDHGIWYADNEKWPDLKGFIAKQHAQNRKVLLWVCVGTEGLPDDELYRVEDMKLLDPCNPKYRRRLEKALYYMLGDDSDCLNADGIKLDFTGNVPCAGDAYCTRKLHGMEYLYELFKAIHDAAKKAKADSLLDFQVANPHFAAFHDMSRLNDYYLFPENALEIMKVRAEIAHSVTFGALVDTDHPKSKEYLAHSHEFGNISLYLTNQEIEDNGEEIVSLRDAIKCL